MKKRSNWRLSQNGFTLIELLVVIAIIAILAAILFPVFAAAREKARMTACLSNEKQIGLAIIQYTQDYDDGFPVGWNTGSAAQYGSGWAGLIYPYVKSAGVFACPDDTSAATSGAGPQVVSYAYNWGFTYSGNQINNNPIGAVTLSQLTAPSSTILFCEVQGYSTNLPSTPASPDKLSPTANVTCNSSMLPGTILSFFSNAGYATGAPPDVPWIQAPARTNGRHNSGSNYIGADGHCKWLPASRISAGRAASGSEQGDAQAAGNPQTPNTCNGTGPRPTGTACMDNVDSDASCAHSGTAAMTFSKI